jgi:hypothetical protein
MNCRRTNSARAFGACLLTAVLGIAACGDDDDEETETPAVAGPVSLAITEVSARNNEWVAIPTEEPLKLGCDRTLAVRITLDPARNFPLRPVVACGSLEQCGIVRFDLLDESGTVLASTESALSAGLIALDDASAEAVTGVSATLLHGKDDETVEFEQDGESVSASAELSLLEPASEDCKSQGDGGAAMAGGGAAGSGTGGATELGGAGGRDPDEGSAGAGGSEGGTPGAGGTSGTSGTGGTAGTSGGGTAGSMSLGGGGAQG